jgi:hypothetical protein
MSLLAPLFLLGMGAIALPLWLHRLQIQSPVRKPYSSTMLLQPSEQQVHLTRKFRYLLLLAMRIALLALLALTFAGPVLQLARPPAADSGAVTHLLVIDNSFSMQQGERFPDGLEEARRIIENMTVGDQASIILAGSTLTLLADAESDRAVLRSALTALDAGDSRLDLGILMTGLDGMLRDTDRKAMIHIISDFQISGLPARFSDLVPDQDAKRKIELKLYPVAGTIQPNWRIDSILQTDTGLDVPVQGYHTDDTELTLTIEVNGMPLQSLSRTVPGSGRTVFRFPALDFDKGENRVTANLSPDDALTGDNTYYAVVDNSELKPVLLLTAAAGTRPVTYLETALAAGLTKFRAEITNFADLDPRVLPRYPWIMIDDLGAVDARLAEALTAYLQNGGAILATLGEHTLGRQQLPVTRHNITPSGFTSAATDYRSVARIDTSHPVLNRAANWRNVNISRMFILTTGADDHRLVSMENGDPLLLEHTIGNGRLLLLATNLDNIWNDLPIHPVFVSFISETAHYLANDDQVERQRIAGTTLFLKQAGYTSGQVVDPDGRTVLTLADTQRAQDIRLNQRGFYQVYTPGRESLVAVNADSRESEPDIMQTDALTAWQQAVISQGVLPDAPAAIPAVASENLPVWQWLLMLLVVIALAESLLGNYYLTYRAGF